MRLTRIGPNLDTFMNVFKPFADKGVLPKEEVYSLRCALSDMIMQCSKEDLEALVFSVIDLDAMSK